MRILNQKSQINEQNDLLFISQVAPVFTFLHLLSSLLIGHPRIRTHTQTEGLPQEDAVTPHVALWAVATYNSQPQYRRHQPQTHSINVCERFLQWCNKVRQVRCITVVESFWSSPFDGNLFEPRWWIDPIILLTTHPKITDLQHAVVSNQTVPRCQVPDKPTEWHHHFFHIMKGRRT